jgi:phosphohistidine phosphatase
MLELWILRHGKAEEAQIDKKDFDRHLSKKGIAQINQLSQHLKDKGTSIDEVIVSSAIRTLETSRIVESHLGLSQIVKEEALYLADLETIKRIVLDTNRAQRLLYVGHNFGISHFVSYLADERISLSTGMCVHFQFDVDHWSEIIEGSGRIVSIFKPHIIQP